MVECITCAELFPFGLSMELMNHYYEHIDHCNWADYTHWCPHNLKSIKLKTKGL